MNMLQAEREMFDLHRPEIAQNAVHALGVGVVQLLQEEDQPEIGIGYLRQEMVDKRLASSEDAADMTLWGLKDSGYIGIDVLNARVSLYRDENNVLVNKQTGESHI